MELLIWLIIFGVFLLIGLYLAVHNIYLRTKGQGVSPGLSKARRAYVAVAAGMLTFVLLSMVFSPFMGIHVVRAVLQSVALVVSVLVGVQAFKALGRRKSRS